ncbi:PaaI family thioesterase [Pseudobacillus wudalianchiensis]|uniref:Thioesterase n=1 Tax=Pseudobacillus wudalianchiensis TaxID=1743143 RepID=A0A1B9AJB5_9BACI|nr:PaaI family thioesterase [Bacillus wudalianchiensis]OCA83939.1 thioesterase [Bacillus wudalianchiensis]
MKDRIYSLIEKSIQQADETELKVLEQMLKGYLEKVEGKGTYIGRLLQLNRITGENECEVHMPITDLTNNSLHIVHGGVTATALDSAMGSAAYTATPEGYATVTSNLNIHYIAPGKGDQLTVKARVIHKGSKTIVVEGEALREDGKKVAHATGTFFLIKRK